MEVYMSKIISEDIQSCIGLLFENFWIIREYQRDDYAQIKRNEKELRRIVERQFGFRLRVHAKFIRLEKIPFLPQSWMGIQAFTQQMDYVLFACAMAYTEDKGEGESFLLNELIEEIELNYPVKDDLDWTNYNHRKSLVRVLNEMTKRHLIGIIEGDNETFAHNLRSEVLYKVSVYSRYYMRSYPEDLAGMKDWHQLAKTQQDSGEELVRLEAFQRLLMEPAVRRTPKNGYLFYYFRNKQQYIEGVIEDYTPFTFELTKDMAMLTVTDRLRKYTLFPSLKTADECLLQLADLIRQKDYQQDEYGVIRLSYNQWRVLIGENAERNREGWSVEYRESSMNRLLELIFDSGKDWGFFEQDDEHNVLIFPSFARSIGKYPSDFDPEKIIAMRKEKMKEKEAK